MVYSEASGAPILFAHRHHYTPYFWHCRNHSLCVNMKLIVISFACSHRLLFMSSNLPWLDTCSDCSDAENKILSCICMHANRDHVPMFSAHTIFDLVLFIRCILLAHALLLSFTHERYQRIHSLTTGSCHTYVSVYSVGLFFLLLESIWI